MDHTYIHTDVINVLNTVRLQSRSLYVRTYVLTIVFDSDSGVESISCCNISFLFQL